MSTDAQQDAIVIPFRDDGDRVKELVECANPRCDEQFMRTPGVGRPKFFHSDDCRRRAEKDLRRTQTSIRQHEQQLEQLRAQEAAYFHLASGEPTTGPTNAERLAAREAYLEVKGMARFLTDHQGEFAGDLKKFFDAVAPLLDES